MENPIAVIRQTKGGITRKELSHKTQVSYAALCNLEAGMPLSMSQKTAAKIGAFAGVQARAVMESYRDYRESLKE